MNLMKKKRAEASAESKQIYNRVKASLYDGRRINEPVSIEKYMSCVRKTVFNGETVDDYAPAIQAALNFNTDVVIPYYDHPLYIGSTIILNSGNSLSVHPETQLVRVGDGIFVRNRNVMDGHYNYIEPGAHSDRDICISGGIWEAPESIIINSERPYDGFLGSDALFLIHNVIGVRFEHITIRHSNRMGLMIGNCASFTVDDITFIDQHRDGIHVEGPAYNGLISNLHGNSGDDLVALNAWDWTISSLTFGAIHDIIVENIECQPGYLWSEMRFHPGNYVLPSGRIIECPVYNTVFRNITGIHTVKLYNQPDLMPGLNYDKSFGLGSVYNLYFENMTFDYYDAANYYTVKNACFELHADSFNLNFKNIKVNYPLRSPEYSDYSLLAVGPISATWKISDDPETWFDFFDPNSNCHADSIAMEGIEVCGEPCCDADKLLNIRHQTINPDYPNTTPKGGVGFGTVKDFYLA